MDGIRFAFAPAPPVVDAAPATRHAIRLVPDDVVHAVDRRFVSLHLDVTQLIRPALGFDRPGWLTLARALAPAFLRLGGPLADRTFFDLSSRARPTPEGYDAVVDAARWDQLTGFAQDAGFALVVPLNAGRGSRIASTAWQSNQAVHQMRYATARRDPVLAWAFGYPESSDRPRFDQMDITPTQYARDLATAATAIRAHAGGGWLAGTLANLDGDERASAREVLDVVLHREDLEAAVDAPPATDDRPTWLETAPTADSAARWLDRLGRAARARHQVTTRPALGADPAALIDEATLTPRATYWATVLWRRLMGREVVAVRTSDPSDSWPALTPIRAYAHWTPAGDGFPDNAITVLAINTTDAPAALNVSGVAFDTAVVFHNDGGTGPFTVNGKAMDIDGGGQLPTVTGHVHSMDAGATRFNLDPRGFAFIVIAPTGASFGVP